MTYRIPTRHEATKVLRDLTTGKSEFEVMNQHHISRSTLKRILNKKGRYSNLDLTETPSNTNNDALETTKILSENDNIQNKTSAPSKTKKPKSQKRRGQTLKANDGIISSKIDVNPDEMPITIKTTSKEAYLDVIHALCIKAGFDVEVLTNGLLIWYSKK